MRGRILTVLLGMAPLAASLWTREQPQTDAMQPPLERHSVMDVRAAGLIRLDSEPSDPRYTEETFRNASTVLAGVQHLQNGSTYRKAKESGHAA